MFIPSGSLGLVLLVGISLAKRSRPRSAGVFVSTSHFYELLSNADRKVPVSVSLAAILVMRKSDFQPGPLGSANWAKTPFRKDL